jgi:putative oxidoreductase
MSKLVKVLEVNVWFPALISRLVVGWIFVETGWGKLHHLPKVVEFFKSLGIPAAHLQAPFVAGLELVCGVLLLLGIWTRIASVPLAAIMAVALLTAKRAEIHSVSDLFGNSEFLYIVILVWLIFQGSGYVSLGGKLKRR